jgi:hypothetical protein
MASDPIQKQDVVITVLGGCVTGVFTDIPDVRVIVVDWDNINDAPLESLTVGAERSLPWTLQQMPSETHLAYRCAIASSPSSK